MTATRERGFRGSRLLPIAVVLVAAVLRIAALGVWKANLADDRDDYLTVARQYVAHGFWEPFDGPLNSFRPPLYPLLLAALLKWGGGSLAIGLLQVALGTATVALTWRVAARLDLGALALVAAGLVALDPLLIAYTTFPMTETLFTFLVILLTDRVLSASSAATGRAQIAKAPSPQTVSRPASITSAWQAVFVGVVFGGCALCRPTIWPTAALIGVWLAWRAWQNTGFIRSVIGPAALIVFSTLLVVSPWALRNWKILGSPIVTTTHGGYTLLLGNNADFYEHVAARPLTDEWTDREPDRFQAAWFREMTTEMDREIGPNAGEVAQDRWMYRQAWQSISAEPRLFLRACLLRFVRFWNVVPLMPSRSSVSSFVVWGICLGYAIELGLFVIGIGVLLRRPDQRWLLPAAVILNFSLVHLVYWSNMRMRAPLVPLIALVAARGLGAFLRARKVKSEVADSGVAGVP